MSFISLIFLKKFDVSVSFLSGICVTCRKTLKTLTDEEQASTISQSAQIEMDLNVVEQLGNLTLVRIKTMNIDFLAYHLANSITIYL